MKNLFSLLIITIFLSTATFGQVVDKAQRTFIHERTADWCPLCGGWGWNFKDQVLDFIKNKPAIFVAIHHGTSGLANTTSRAISDNFGGVGQPLFFVDGTDINVGSGTQAKGLMDIEAIYDFNTSVEAFAGVGLVATVNPNTKTLNVKANVEFFTSVSGGNYFLGLYLLQNVVNPQSGRPNNTLHYNVLTKNFFSTPFGNSIKAGVIENGEKFSFEANLNDINTNPKDMKVLGVIWNQTNNKYLYFNSNISDIVVSTDAKDIELVSDMTSFQSESGAIHIEVNTTNAMKNSQLKLSDMAGKVVYSKNGIDIKEGNNQLTIPTQKQTGVYLITLTNGSNIKSTKIMVQ